MVNVYQAQTDGRYIEAPAEIFKHYNVPVEQKKMVFQNVMVYLEGHAEAVIKEDNTPVHERLHGTSEGVLLGK